jgi:hypothetical protein
VSLIPPKKLPLYFRTTRRAWLVFCCWDKHHPHFSSSCFSNDLSGIIIACDHSLDFWFGREDGDEGDCIGPRDQKDFNEVAKMTEIYQDEADVLSTYNTVHQERVNRRRLGRLLRTALRGLARGNAFDQAVNTAQALDTEVEEVMYAVELHEIAKARTIE